VQSFHADFFGSRHFATIRGLIIALQVPVSIVVRCSWDTYSTPRQLSARYCDRLITVSARCVWPEPPAPVDSDDAESELQRASGIIPGYRGAEGNPVNKKRLRCS